MYGDKGKFYDSSGHIRRNREGAPPKELVIPIKILCELFNVSHQTIHRWARSTKDKMGNKIPALLNTKSLLSICEMYYNKQLALNNKMGRSK